VRNHVPENDNIWMEERDMDQEGQNRKRKRWGIERKMIFYLFFWNC
jgi:hypothetical protein